MTKPETAGEELYLVHLQRESGVEHEPEDYDVEPANQRTRGHSVGEELWEVHLQRSKGMALDTDNDRVGTTGNEKQEHHVGNGANPPSPNRRYNLRNRTAASKAT